MKGEEIKQECLSGRKWLRLIFMVVFAAVSYFGIFLVWIIGFFQFVFHLITGKTCSPLEKFSVPLSQYISDIVSYLCFNTEEMPFPFSDWPAGGKKKETPKTTSPAPTANDPKPKAAESADK